MITFFLNIMLCKAVVLSIKWWIEYLHNHYFTGPSSGPWAIENIWWWPWSCLWDCWPHSPSQAPHPSQGPKPPTRNLRELHYSFLVGSLVHKLFSINSACLVLYWVQCSFLRRWDSRNWHLRCANNIAFYLKNNCKCQYLLIC